MTEELGTFDSEQAHNINLNSLIKVMSDAGVKKIFLKKLAPNDNSKNQPYFGFHLTDLPFIPTGEIEASQSTSNKIKETSRKIKYQAPVNLIWLDACGNRYPAPHAKLIYYPQYPEVRFSGFLRGSEVNASRWMSPQKQGRAQGRWLILGVSDSSEVFSYLVTPESSLSTELESVEFIHTTNIFREVSLGNRVTITDTRDALIAKLLEIHRMGWIAGQKLGKDLIPMAYKAQNGGGYTLESLLGITPNGIAEPDFLGWEVKQFSVKGFPRNSAKPTTLMTPEPNGGIYKEQGAAEFMRRFGYPDKSGKPDRINFGGKHVANSTCKTTRLKLNLEGFDEHNLTITNANGAISLTNEAGTIAASWSFPKIMDHWKRKHSQAVYIPCLMRSLPNGEREYHYGNEIELGTGTSFEMLLSAMARGFVYYDPGIKLENASNPNSTLKKRSQFRVNHKHLNTLYNLLDYINIAV